MLIIDYNILIQNTFKTSNLNNDDNTFTTSNLNNDDNSSETNYDFNYYNTSDFNYDNTFKKSNFNNNFEASKFKPLPFCNTPKINSDFNDIFDTANFNKS